jgi:putative transposase
LIEVAFRKRKKIVIGSWRMDETYIKVKGKWMFLYRAVNKAGKRRNKFVARKFPLKAISNNGCPKVINIDKRGANKEAIRTYNKRYLKRIRIRQCKYLNNRGEGDHRFIKSRIQSMLGFKSFKSASRALSGIERVRMIKKGTTVLSLDKCLQILLLIAGIRIVAWKIIMLLLTAATGPV